MSLFFIIVAAIIVGHLALAVLITYPREIGIGLVSLVALAVGVLYAMANPEIAAQGVIVSVCLALIAGLWLASEKNKNRKKSLVNPHWRAEEASARQKWLEAERVRRGVPTWRSEM